MKLHYNRSNKQFSIRNKTRLVESYTRKRMDLPSIFRMPLGDTLELSPSVHVVITRGKLLEARDKHSRPELAVVVTKCPLWHLLKERIKEIF